MMKMKPHVVHFIAIVSLLVISKNVKSARILGVFPYPWRSQFILGEKLMGELAERGHNVTVISAYEPAKKIQNYDTVLIDVIDPGKKIRADLLSWKTYNDFENAKTLFDFWSAISEGLANQQAIHDLILSNSTFDLVIFEFFGNEAQMGLAKHFNAPLVVVSSLGMNEWCSNLVGNIKLPTITPFSLSQRTNHMSFFERFKNTVVSVYEILYKELSYYPKQQKIMNKYFGKDMNLKEVMSNVSFLLLNSHPLIAEPSILTSATVEIGGFHISPKKLPLDIHKFLDGAKDGAILINLENNLDSIILPNKTINSLIRAIDELPYRVLWKFDSSLTNKPKNLMISKWLPQSDILAHPNVLAFVTHSDLLSITEAVYHGVPMVTIPVFGSQHMNSLRAVKNGVAIQLDINNLKEDTFYETLTEVITNEKYQERAKKLSKMFRDTPVHPLDLAIHTIEYVIKYQPATYFRSPALDLSWFQLYLLDILLFVVVLYTLIKSIIVRDTRNKKVKTTYIFV